MKPSKYLFYCVVESVPFYSSAKRPDSQHALRPEGLISKLPVIESRKRAKHVKGWKENINVKVLKADLVSPTGALYFTKTDCKP